MDRQIPIGRTGRIVSAQEDSYVGRFVRVEESGGGAYLIINSPKRYFVHGEIDDEVWDDWVENEEDLRGYFGSAHGRGWVVEWLDSAEALIVWQMNEPGGVFVRDTIHSTLDTAGVRYSEPMAGVCLLQLDSHHDYDALCELLEDALMDRPPDFPIFFIPPFRHVGVGE